jgi:hypothetical protein
MTTKVKQNEFGPSQSAQMLRALREAAERFQRLEFEKIVNPPVQLKLNFE